MRIVAVADTHTFERDLGTLPAGDVFIHAGDLLRAGTIDELQIVAAWIRSQPHPVKIVIAGNHDWCFVHDPVAARLTLGSDVIYLQDSGISIDGLKFWGSPWQPDYNEWAFNLTRGQALAEKWSLIPDDVDILITHGTPQGIGDRDPVPARAGCADLLCAVRRVQPALHLFGHCHQDGGLWRIDETWLANVTTWESERRSTVIDIDQVTRQVKPVVIPPSTP
ncbi:MAG: metallophosphatase domain-containing protein [Anaerolineae bacterium]|nr:metallophosphatase domain-containing protein [Anaerolineae bacterium]